MLHAMGHCQVLCCCEAGWRGVLTAHSLSLLLPGLVLSSRELELCVLWDCELVLLTIGEMAFP